MVRRIQEYVLRWLARRLGYALVPLVVPIPADRRKGPFPARVVDGAVHPGLEHPE